MLCPEQLVSVFLCELHIFRKCLGGFRLDKSRQALVVGVVTPMIQILSFFNFLTPSVSYYIVLFVCDQFG